MYINQNSKVNDCLLNSMLEKYGKYSARLDEACIRDDINLVNSFLEKEKNKLKVKSYKQIKSYLEKLLNICKEDRKISIAFETDGKQIGGFPLNTMKVDEPKLGLRLEYLDYVVIASNLSIVRLNYSHLMSGLALEVAKDDLGYDMEYVEEQLKETSLVVVNDSSILDTFMEDDDLSRVVSEFRIGESDYYDKVKKEAHSYFLDKVKDTYSYAGIISSTMKKAMALIAADLLYQFSNYDDDLSVGILAIYDDELVLVASKIDRNILNILNKPICALILGRKFIFNTAVNIIERKQQS